MNTTTLPSPRSVSRRRFLGSSTAVAGSLVVGFHIPDSPLVGKALAQARERRDQRLGGHQARRHRGRAHRAQRDGPGHAHRPGATGGRRTRVRLGQGDHRVPDTGPERGAQPRVAELLHRRQPRHPRVQRLRAQRRRSGPHDAGAGRRQFVERAGQRMHGGQRRGHAQQERPQRALWAARRCSGQAARAGRGRRRAQGSQDLEDRRQAGGAPRHARQGRRLAGLRHGPEAAQHVERGDQGLPGVRRQDQELRCGRSGQSARREEGGAGRRQRGRGGGRHLVARQDRARCAADRQWDEGPNAKTSSADAAADAEGRPHAQTKRCRPTRWAT